MNYDWADASSVASTETGYGNRPDYRLFNHSLCCTCEAMLENEFQQHQCKWYRVNSSKMRCMYQKWDSMNICDKVTDKDGKGVN